MNRIINLLLREILKHGSLSKPWLNYALSEDLSQPWKYFLQGLRYKWERRYQKSLTEINKGLKEGFASKTLKYLFLAEKLSLLRRVKDSQTKDIYCKLQSEYQKIPQLARYDVATVLINAYALSPEDLGLPKPRLYSRYYQMDKATWVFILLGRAREEVKKNHLSEALPLYLEALEMALTIPHPTGIINSLNDLAWYLKEEDPAYALSLTKQASYHLGYYREDIESHPEVIHTLWEIQRITQDLQLCDTCEILNFLAKNLSIRQEKHLKERYLEMFQTCQTLNLNLETSFYENSDDLRATLRKYILSLSQVSRVSGISRSKLTNILKGKVKHIRGNTLQRLIKHLNLKIYPLTTPLPLLQEAKKLKIEERLKDNLLKLASLSPSERIILFFSTYMVLSGIKDLSYLKRRDILSKVLNLLLDNREPFFNFLSSRWETKEFLFSMFNTLHPLLEGRRDLAKGFLKRLSKKRLISFIKTYASLNEDSRQILNTFIRNYSRYGRSWIRLSSPESLKSFIKTYNLSETRSTLAYYAWDKERERKRFISLLGVI